MATVSLRKNAVYNGIKTISTILFPLITFPYISRVLLPDNIGKINFGLSVISYFSLLSMLGMSTYAIRECARIKSSKSDLSQTSSELFSISICTTVISYIFLFITLFSFRKFDGYRTLIVVQSTTILFTTLGADWLNSAMEDFRYITIRTMIFQVVSIVAMFLFVKGPEDYLKYATISVISNSGAGIVNIWYRKRYCSVRFTFNMNLRKHLGPIFAFFSMVLSTTIFANADTTMLGFMCGDYQVGIYSAAHKISQLVSQLVQSIIVVLMPRLVVFFADNDFENANRLLRKLLNFNITFGLPCVTGVIMVAADAVFVFAGEEFLASANVLRIMILCFMFSLVGGSFLGNGVLLPMGKEKYYMFICLLTAVCNIVLNAVFIPIFQASAAAATSAFNGLLIFILLLLKVDKRIHIDQLLRVFISPVVGCAGIVAVCMVLKCIANVYVRLTASVVISALAYTIILFALKNDIAVELLDALKSKFKRIQGGT